MSPTISLILDALIAGLLVATIIYAIQLNRHLIQLRESRGEMEGLIRSFNEATSRAEAGIKSIRHAATETGEGLQRSVERAQVLRDELQFLVEAADSLARRLAETPSHVKAGHAHAAPQQQAPSRSQPKESHDSPRARAQELLRGFGNDLARGQPAEPAHNNHPSEAQPRSRGQMSRAEPASSRSARTVDAEEGQDLPRGRGVLTRGDNGASPSARLSDLLDTSQDLPRGRGILTRGEAFRADPPAARTEVARAEPSRGERRAPEPTRRDSGEGLSRAERELLQAIESRR